MSLRARIRRSLGFLFGGVLLAPFGFVTIGPSGLIGGALVGAGITCLPRAPVQRAAPWLVLGQLASGLWVRIQMSGEFDWDLPAHRAGFTVNLLLGVLAAASATLAVARALGDAGSPALALQLGRTAGWLGIGGGALSLLWIVPSRNAPGVMAALAVDAAVLWLAHLWLAYLLWDVLNRFQRQSERNSTRRVARPK